MRHTRSGGQIAAEANESSEFALQTAVVEAGVHPVEWELYALRARVRSNLAEWSSP